MIPVAPGLTCLGCSGDPAPVIVSVEGVVIASFVADSPGVRTATVFYTSDAYRQGLRDGVEVAQRQVAVEVIDVVLAGLEPVRLRVVQWRDGGWVLGH